MLSNETLLEEERLKAKTIREKMSGIVGGSNYNYSQGGNTGSRYDGYDSRNFKPESGGNTTGFGGYGYEQSTLSKYKKESGTGSGTGSGSGTGTCTGTGTGSGSSKKV